MHLSYAKLVPVGVEDWPIAHKIVRPTSHAKLESLGDCPNTLRYKTGSYSHKLAASCGLETVSTYNRAAFGRDGEPILSQLPAPSYPVSTVVTYQGGQRVEVGNYWQKKREDEDKYKLLWEQRQKEEDEWENLYAGYLG